MNMHRMKDDCLAALLLLASMLVSDVGGLFISKEMATILKNETFFVMCRDENGSPVTWRGPKGLLGPKTRPKVQVASFGTSIIFNAAVSEDEGTYTCSNENGERKDFHLSITAPLTFMDTSTDQIGVEGKPFTLRCEVQGGKITWSIEGGDIIDKEKFMVGGDGLVIKKLDRSDSKTYICKAVQQSTGAVQDRRINLRVMHKPTFTHPMYAKQELAWGYINGTVNLTCVVVADPPAAFQWLKNNDKKQKIGKVINESADVSILQLHVENSTFGEYKCIAKNQYGTIEKRFSLEQGVQPKPPQIAQVNAVNSNFADLEVQGPDSAEVKPGMEPTGFNVQYRKKEDSEWDSREFNMTKENVYRLDNLTHKTEYEVRVATRNAVGLSSYSEILPVTTLASQKDGVRPISCSLYTVVIVLFKMYDLAFW